jgi:hypothetical protein
MKCLEISGYMDAYKVAASMYNEMYAAAKATLSPRIVGNTKQIYPYDGYLDNL